jgi:hypothetical protein
MAQAAQKFVGQNFFLGKAKQDQIQLRRRRLFTWVGVYITTNRFEVLAALRVRVHTPDPS